ncbi:MAG: hypothetical protein ACJ77N_12775 [Chloroflexota bacterium]
MSLGTCNGLGAPDTWVGGPQGAAAAVDLPAIPFPGQPVGSAPAVLRPPALTPPGGVATAQEADVVAKATRDQGSQGTNRWFVVQSGSRYYAFAGTDLGSAAAPSPSAAAAPCRVDPSSYSLAALHAMAFVPGASGNRAFAFDYLTGQQATITDVSTGQIVWRGAIGAPTPSSQPGAGQGTQPPTGSASATPSQASLAPGSSPATAPESPPATQAGSSPGQGGIGIIPTQAGRTAEAWLLSVALGRRAGLSNCATEAVPDPEDGVIAFARCGYAIGPEGVTFRLFRDGPSLDAYVAGRRSDGRGNRTDVCPQQWQWKPGAPEGVMLCSDATVKGKPYGLVQWTERDWHIFGNLAVPNGDVRNLYTHWLTDIIVDSPSAHQPQ